MDGVGVVGLVAGAEAWRLERGSRNVPYLLASATIVGELAVDKRLPASGGKSVVVSVASAVLLSSVSTDV